MIPRLVVAVAGLVALGGPVSAADPPAKPKPGTTEHVLAALRQPVKLDAGFADAPLGELVGYLGKRYDVAFVVRDGLFRRESGAEIKDAKPTLPAAVDGLPLHRLLTLALDDVGAAYLVRGGYVEIVPATHAAKETKNVTGSDEGTPRLKEPLVSAVYKEKPLVEAVADLAETYDLTVVVAPQAADNRTGFVNVRLLNIPADRALDLLALQADLRVVRKGTAYLITNKDHADTLLAEQLEREKQRQELRNLRNGANNGQPPPPPPGVGAPLPPPTP